MFPSHDSMQRKIERKRDKQQLMNELLKATMSKEQERMKAIMEELKML